MFFVQLFEKGLCWLGKASKEVRGVIVHCFSVGNGGTVSLLSLPISVFL